MRKSTAIITGIATVVATIGIGVPAWAAVSVPKGTTISTVTEVKKVSTAKCYTTHRVTITTYHWSAKTGWTKYAAPKKTVTDSTTCH